MIIIVWNDQEVENISNKVQALEFYQWCIKILQQRVETIKKCDDRATFILDLSMLWKI